MDGNRGAKGSIKDRLISMLYRLRYAKKVKKEEEYEISKKEKQVEYLKKLVNLKENENIDVLDSSDMNELNKIKITANYHLNNNFVLVRETSKEKNISSQSTSMSKLNSADTQVMYERKKKVGISDDQNNVLILKDSDVLSNIELKLNDVEFKSSELDEKVDLKKEISKTKNEVVILEEVDKFIKKSKETLEEINLEVESLKEISKEKNQNTEELEQRYKKLREKVDKLKAQYDAVKDKYDLSEFSILESIKLIDNIKDYKNKASLNEMDMMIKVCKKEITKIESITVEYEETKKVGNDISKIKDDQKKIKVKFHKSKEEINRINDIEEEISQDLKTQEEIIDDMYDEASRFERIVKKEVEYIRHGGVFSSLLKIAGGILTLPFTGANIFGIALGSTLINRGLKTLNSCFETKEKIVHDYIYTDIAYKINEVKDKIEYTSLIISDNLEEIKKLKNNFKKYFEYNKVLPEYDSMFGKLNKLEDKLRLQQQKISKMDKKLEEEKTLNNEKMKKVKKLNGKY